MMQIQFTQRVPPGCYGAMLDESYEEGQSIATTEMRGLQFISQRIAREIEEPVTTPPTKKEYAPIKRTNYDALNVMGVIGAIMLGIGLFFSISDNIRANEYAELEAKQDEQMARLHAETQAKIMELDLKFKGKQYAAQ